MQWQVVVVPREAGVDDLPLFLARTSHVGGISCEGCGHLRQPLVRICGGYMQAADVVEKLTNPLPVLVIDALGVAPEIAQIISDFVAL